MAAGASRARHRAGAELGPPVTPVLRRPRAPALPPLPPPAPVPPTPPHLCGPDPRPSPRGPPAPTGEHFVRAFLENKVSGPTSTPSSKLGLFAQRRHVF